MQKRCFAKNIIKQEITVRKFKIDVLIVFILIEMPYDTVCALKLKAYFARIA